MAKDAKTIENEIKFFEAMEKFNTELMEIASSFKAYAMTIDTTGSKDDPQFMQAYARAINAANEIEQASRMPLKAIPIIITAKRLEQCTKDES